MSVTLMEENKTWLRAVLSPVDHKHPAEHASEGIEKYFQGGHEALLDLLKTEEFFRKLIFGSDTQAQHNYLYENFISWVVRYAKKSDKLLGDYLLNKLELNDLTKDFVRFCFLNCISLDFQQTLDSFNYHNQLSDCAIKNELKQLKPKKNINLLGFGLDDGAYEKKIARHLISEKIAESVRIYGFDPFANKSEGVVYLAENFFRLTDAPFFDIILARWVLHHVNSKFRWSSFVNCVDRCNRGSLVLIVEHGFLNKNSSALHENLYCFVNAAFDVLANIGLRPRYLLSKTKTREEDFFIEYLQDKDFFEMENRFKFKVKREIYHVGPEFPNQTICKINPA